MITGALRGEKSLQLVFINHSVFFSVAVYSSPVLTLSGIHGMQKFIDA